MVGSKVPVGRYSHAVQEMTLNGYQLQRAQNIERNNARLRSLGLISAREEQGSNDRAWQRPSALAAAALDDEHDASSFVDEPKSRRKRPRRREQVESPKKAEQRKSLRSDCHPASTKTSQSQVLPSASRSSSYQHDVDECRRVRLERAQEYEKLHGADQAAQENPTASYEHCLMRVCTMSEHALRNRIKAIERAAGKHCLIKIAIFKSCLQERSLPELATLANEALERLKGSVTTDGSTDSSAATSS